MTLTTLPSRRTPSGPMCLAISAMNASSLPLKASAIFVGPPRAHPRPRASMRATRCGSVSCASRFFMKPCTQRCANSAFRSHAPGCCGAGGGGTVGGFAAGDPAFVSSAMAGRTPHRAPRHNEAFKNSLRSIIPSSGSSAADEEPSTRGRIVERSARGYGCDCEETPFRPLQPPFWGRSCETKCGAPSPRRQRHACRVPALECHLHRRGRHRRLDAQTVDLPRQERDHLAG